MEMKKSISDSERALRSYGAVSETAWTTDKGELGELAAFVITVEIKCGSGDWKQTGNVPV